MARKREQWVQGDLFGDAIEEREEPRTEIVPFEFETQRVRVVVIRGETWWIAADVCRVLEIGNVSMAITRLDEDEKTTLNTIEGGGQTITFNIINESGLYALILTSRKPGAKRFKRWVTHEVLPTIRRTGRYALSRRDRVSSVAKRLKMDRATAKIRCDQYIINRSANLRLAGEGAKPSDFAAFHNAAYRGQFGMEAPKLRKLLGLKTYRQTPLDRMEGLPLAQNWHAKLLAELLIQETDPGMPREDQCRVVELAAREIKTADFSKLGYDYIYDIKDDPARGQVIGVARRQLPVS